jgi:serine/threonine protein kinase/tetratricopeptide (TPR) repeat protein
MTKFSPGEVLNDRYRLDEELGRGGTGTVLRAHDPELNRDVAIKVLTNLGLGTDGQARLQQEAQAIARLNHPNIVAVYDVGELDEVPFIVMEYVEGWDIHSRAPADFPEIVSVARQVCMALQHAHESGVIHRDLKPENILLQPDGTAKLVDFGIARSVASRMTSEGQITGTVYYLAPELALGQGFDGRADLYALGVMLYELSVGSLPFDKGDPLTIVSQHINAPPIPPRARNPEISPRLEALILQLMAKEQSERPASAAAVVEALDDPDFLDLAAVTDQEMAVLGRIARGRFVGRKKELKKARTIWTQTMAGSGQTLLISGEPGIGKSSLTRELATQAEISGGNALIGESYAEGGAPYSPFSQILRRALPKASQNGSQMSEFVVADLISLTPELRPNYPDLPEIPALDPDSEQRRLFESMVVLLSSLSEQSPILLILEDVHWADSGSLAMLRHLARRTKGQPIMLVATYREVELDESLPLQEMLVELNRERIASRLKLVRFGVDETQELLATIFQEEVSMEFTEGIYNETEGNPFFIEEVCKSLVEEGALYYENGEWHRPDDMADLDIPQSVRVAIQSRLLKLPDEILDSLRMAAILGREFDFDTLVAAAELDEETLIDALEHAEHAQLIEEIGSGSGGTFRFAHALIGSTLEEGLSGLRRRRMHHQVAAVIEEMRPDDYEALAHHYYESGDMDKGLEYSLKAGERALSRSAYNEARRHYGRALEIAEVDRRQDELASIYLALGDIESLRDLNLALSYYEQALELTQDPIEQAIIKGKIGSLKTFTGYEEGLSLLEEAVETLDTETHGNEVAQAIGAIGRFHHNRGQHRKALEQLEKAREIAEPLEDVETLNYVYVYLAGTYQHLAEVERSNEWAEREIEMGTRANYALAEAVGNEYLSENHGFMGRWEEALTYADRDEEIGQEKGLTNRVHWAKLCKLWAWRGLGQLGRAIEEGTLSLEQAESTGERRLAVLAGAELANAYADKGDFDLASQLAEVAAERALELEQAYMIATAQDALAYLPELQGDWQKARAIRGVTVEAALGTDNRLIPMVNGPGLAEALLEAKQVDEADELVQGVLQISERNRYPVVAARALRVLGRIHAHREEFEQAAETFAEALMICEKWNSRLLAGRILLDWAALEAAQGSTEAAEGKLERALEIFESSGAKFWVERTRAALDELALEEVSQDS